MPNDKTDTTPEEMTEKESLKEDVLRVANYLESAYNVFANQPSLYAYNSFQRIMSILGEVPTHTNEENFLEWAKEHFEYEPGCRVRTLNWIHFNHKDKTIAEFLDYMVRGHGYRDFRYAPNIGKKAIAYLETQLEKVPA